MSLAAIGRFVWDALRELWWVVLIVLGLTLLFVLVGRVVRADERSPTLEFQAPAHARMLAVVAYRDGQVRKWQRKVPAERVCNGWVRTEQGPRRTCSVWDADPRYQYVIRLYDRWGDRLTGSGPVTLVCSHEAAGWLCAEGQER